MSVVCSEIDAYAKEVLEMDPDEDPDLLYIARDALKAPLPKNWKAWYALASCVTLLTLA